MRSPRLVRSQACAQRAFLLGAVLTTTAASADVVTLNNGTRFRGIVTETTAGEITIQSDAAAWTFHRDMVAAVERAAAGRELEEKRELEALKNPPRPPPAKPVSHGDFGAKRDPTGSSRHHRGRRR